MSKMFQKSYQIKWIPNKQPLLFLKLPKKKPSQKQNLLKFLMIAFNGLMDAISAKHQRVSLDTAQRDLANQKSKIHSAFNLSKKFQTIANSGTTAATIASFLMMVTSRTVPPEHALKS